MNGTTGESPTTTDAEKDELIRAVVDAVGDRATVVAGVGTYDTAHCVQLAKAAEKAGAHGLLVVTPYYSRPPQEGLLAHFTAVADATDLPVMLYDIPPRSVVADRAGHPAAGSPSTRGSSRSRTPRATCWRVTEVIATTDLAYYSGDDPLNLPLLSVGAVGIVSVIGHVVGRPARVLVDACEAGDVAARRLHAATCSRVIRAMGRAAAAVDLQPRPRCGCAASTSATRGCR